MKSRILTIIVATGTAALLAACANMPVYPTTAARPPAPPPPPPPPTPAEEFAWSTQHGANSLTVSIAYQPAAGQVWSCSGLTEALMPETSYSRGRMVALYGSAERSVQTVAAVRARSAANPGADYGQYVRTAACDSLDTFTLAGLPDGAYFIIARVRQVRPAGATGEMVIMQRAEVSQGRAVRMTLPQGMPPRPPVAAAPAKPRPRAR